MTVHSLVMYGADGRLRGSWTYMLLCRDGLGPIYVKVGISDNPLKRFNALVTSCGVMPQRFSFVNVRSRDSAKKLEKDLLDAFSKWKTNGEWIRLKVTEKKEFNVAWQKVFEKHATRDWPLRWVQCHAKGLRKYAQRRKRYVQKKHMRRGKAFLDFQKDLSGEKEFRIHTR